MSKGSRRRPSQVSMVVKDLRYELAFNCSTNPERKEEILKLLEEMADDSTSNLQE